MERMMIMVSNRISVTGVLLVGILLAGVSAGWTENAPAAIVLETVGELLITTGGVQRTGSLGSELFPGDTVETTGGLALCMFFINGKKFELQENSLLRINDTALKVVKGQPPVEKGRERIFHPPGKWTSFSTRDNVEVLYNNVSTTPSAPQQEQMVFISDGDGTAYTKPTIFQDPTQLNPGEGDEPTWSIHGDLDFKDGSIRSKKQSIKLKEKKQEEREDESMLSKPEREIEVVSFGDKKPQRQKDTAPTGKQLPGNVMVFNSTRDAGYLVMAIAPSVATSGTLRFSVTLDGREVKSIDSDTWAVEVNKKEWNFMEGQEYRLDVTSSDENDEVRPVGSAYFSMPNEFELYRISEFFKKPLLLRALILEKKEVLVEALYLYSTIARQHPEARSELDGRIRRIEQAAGSE